MICFTAFTPHSPLLIERIGKEHLKKASKTLQALSRVADMLDIAQPEVIFVISAHSVVHETAFSINLHDHYALDFKEFGDHSTTKSFTPDVELIVQIQQTAQAAHIPFVLESVHELSYGSGVPLHIITRTKQYKIVPITYSGTDRKQHMAFGRIIKDVALQSDKRIAILASGDLAHTLATRAPMGFKKEGKEFDDIVKRSIEQFSASQLIALPESIVEQAQQCALRPLLILFGVLEKMKIRPELLSYEAPFGVGYLVALFHHL